jgi:hypothetical protein
VKEEIESVINAIEDLTEVIGGLRDQSAPAPVVNVSPPEVRVEAPVINIPARKPVAYECEVTSRDGKGNIKTFRLTPLETEK